VFSSPEAAVADIFDGAVVLVAGFAGCGSPESLLDALRANGAGNLTAVCHGAWPAWSDAGSGPLATAAGSERSVSGIEALVEGGQVRKLISPLAFYLGHGGPVEARWRSGELEIEVVPQGVLAERLRSGGAGLGGVFLPAGAGTRFGEGREVRRFGGRDHVFEQALRADFALLRADIADTLGNLVYHATHRNWNPVMAMAARVSIVEVGQVLDPGGLDPEAVITPGIFVNRIVETR
jgi:3-oxoadipate CoA-transferase alpha subunit